MAAPAGFTQAEWDKVVGGAKAGMDQLAQTGTFNGATPNQNLAAVANQPGNTSGATAQPYITPNGTTDYHINGGSYTPPSTPTPNPPPSQPATPTATAQPLSAQQSQSQPTQAAPDYAALAAARTAAALARKRTIAEQQKSSLDRSYARSNEITQDNRTLENGRIDRTLNPFSGKTAFDKGIIGRERALIDETSAGNLQAQKSNIDQLLADYENATADEQVRIADELQRADKAYNLELAKFNQDQSNFDKNFNYNSGQDSIKNGQNQQVIDYNQDPSNPSNIGQGLQNQGQAQQNLLNQYKIDDYPAEQKANATKIQQELATGKMNLETAEYNFKQLKDPNSTYNQAAKIDLQLKQMDLKNAPEKARLEFEQLKKQIAQIGVVHYKPQTANEIAMDQVQLATAQKQLDLLNNPKSKPTEIDPKTSTNNYGVLFQDVNDSKDLAEAYNLIEQNAGELTDSDYKQLKEDARKKFEKKAY